MEKEKCVDIRWKKRKVCSAKHEEDYPLQPKVACPNLPTEMVGMMMSTLVMVIAMMMPMLVMVMVMGFVSKATKILPKLFFEYFPETKPYCISTSLQASKMCWL